MSKEKLIQNFNPNSLSPYGGIFGLPFEYGHSELVIFPIPWDVTSSYSAGSSKGPKAILNASYQVDLFDPFVKNAWQLGIYMKEINTTWKKRNKVFRNKAEQYISLLEKGKEHLAQKSLELINNKCQELHNWIERECTNLLNEDKLVILLGGDHSTPFGYIKALAKKHKSFGILQIDAHADLRKGYENFTYSHASIMYNVLENIPQVNKLIQLGIRDYCEEELAYINNSKKVITFFDRDLKHQTFKGIKWSEQVKNIIASLPEKIYLSFDIDGLDPKLCPNTGTPVPGGFELEQITYLLEQIVKSGKSIIGMDLNEVSPGKDNWDANVGARALWRMCNLLGKSNSRI